MAASSLFKKLLNNLWLTGCIFLVCAGISIYYLVQPSDVVINIFGATFSPEISKAVIITIVFILGLFTSILGNLIAAIIQKEDPPKEPNIIKIENIIHTQPEPKPIALEENTHQKFYPTHFLPELEYFVGRTDVLQKIREILARDHRAAIHDISGLGKTFTSYKFAADSEVDYNKIFFIVATKEEMLESLAKCGEMVNPQLTNVEKQEDKALGFKQWLEENERWLVIYDNVDRPNELHPFVPVSRKGDCLLTSNFREVIRLGTEIVVEKLGETNAGILLYSRATNQPQKIPDLTGEEKQAFDKLVGEIDGLPLTLNSTGALIYKKDWTFATFWQQYDKTPEIAWESEDDYSPYQRKSAGIVFSLAYNDLCGVNDNGKISTMRSAWMWIYEKITGKIKIESATKTLLNSISFLSPVEIPEDLLQNILQSKYGAFSESGNKEIFWNGVREKLTGYDLLKYNKFKKIFVTHRSIQKVIQTKLARKEQIIICSKLCKILLHLFPEYDYFNQETCEKYYQHIKTLLENSKKLNIRTVSIKSLYYRIGSYEKLLGNFIRAEQSYQHSVETSAEIFGKKSVHYATALNNIALVYQAQGRYDEAIEKYKEVLRIDEKTLGKEHPDHATHLNNLALAYRSQGKYNEAIEKYEEVLRIDQKTLGKEHPNYAAHLNNLAAMYQIQGRYDEAIEKHVKALSIREKVLGKNHPEHSQSLNNLGYVYYLQGRYDEAIEKFEEAIKITEKVLGTEHPTYATRLNNLALVYHQQSRHDEAIEKYEKALQVIEKSLGQNHPDFAQTLSNLGGVYQSQGRYDEAIRDYEKALQIDEKMVGKEHPDCAIRLNNLATIYETQVEYKKALTFYEKALKIIEKTLSEDHHHTLQLRECVQRCRNKLKNS